MFGEKGYHSSTIADVVRESGLSVGAIYTYFSGKDELIRLTCDQIAARGLDELAERLAPATTTAERLAIAIAPLRRDHRRLRRARPARSPLVQAWAEADREPGVREMLAGRRERLAGAGQMLLRQGVVSGELPAWLDVEAVTRGFLALLDGLLLQRIEAGDAYRPADLERRALARSSSCCSRPAPSPVRADRGLGVRRDGVASLAMAHVQTVLGPIEPDALGFTLPHEHTQIALWHIESRWDYWQLTRDEPVILAELAQFRAAGGSGLVDLTPTGRRARSRPGCVGLAEASDLHIVMGCGWYRTAYYPPEALIDRRSTDDLADELVREATDGVGESGVRPGIIGEIGTDKPWVSPSEERVHRAAARASRRTGLAITTHAVLSDVGLAQLRIFEEEGADPARVVIGHADSYPVLDHYLAIIERGANLEFDFLGMPWPNASASARTASSSWCASSSRRGHADRILFLSQDVCSDSQLKAFGGNGYTYLTETFLPRLRAAGVSEDEITTMTVANPRRLLTIG